MQVQTLDLMTFNTFIARLTIIIQQEYRIKLEAYSRLLGRKQLKALYTTANGVH